MKNIIYQISPIEKSAIWGGNRLSEYSKRNSENIVELWEYVNTCQEANSLISDDRKISDIVDGSRLPVVVKIINAEHDLSLQVHPDKYETLIIIDATFDAKIGLGIKSNQFSLLKSCIASNSVDECLNYCHIKKGDIVYVPAGLVHAIGKGIMAIEIQNASMITYRLYDYNRKIDGKCRELHIDEALSVINCNCEATICHKDDIVQQTISRIFFLRLF